MIVGVARQNLVADSEVVWLTAARGNALWCVCGIQHHACRHMGAHWDASLQDFATHGDNACKPARGHCSSVPQYSYMHDGWGMRLLL
jgi:hypothetical protein